MRDCNGQPEWATTMSNSSNHHEAQGPKFIFDGRVAGHLGAADGLKPLQ